MSPEDFLRALDPALAVAARQSAGGAAVEPLEVMLAQCRARLDTRAAWREGEAARAAAAAEQALLARAQGLNQKLWDPRITRITRIEILHSD